MAEGHMLGPGCLPRQRGSFSLQDVCEGVFAPRRSTNTNPPHDEQGTLEKIEPDGETLKPSANAS